MRLVASESGSAALCNGRRGVWSAGAAWLMSAGFIWAGVVAGSALALAGAIVATTHFCLGSWMYQMFWGRRVPKGRRLTSA